MNADLTPEEARQNYKAMLTRRPHHPSCEAREHQDALDRVSARPRSSGSALTIGILTRRLEAVDCTCGPSAPRTPDTMLLDVLAHADLATLDQPILAGPVGRRLARLLGVL